MQRKDYYLSHSHKDLHLARKLKEYIESKGLSVFLDYTDLEAGSDYVKVITDAIRSCDYMIVLLNASSAGSGWIKSEVSLAIQTAESRNKRIIPVLLDGFDLRDEPGIGSFLLEYQSVRVDTSDPKWPEVLLPFLEAKLQENRKAALYEEISELSKSWLYLKVCDRLVDVVDIILRQIKPGVSLRIQYETVIELDQCLEKLNSFYRRCDEDFSTEARAVTGRKLDMLKDLEGLVKEVPPEKEDLFFACSMIRLIFWDRAIRTDCAEMITHGDVDSLSVSSYSEAQAEYRDLYLRADTSLLQTEAEPVQAFIKETEQYLYESLPVFTDADEKYLEYDEKAPPEHNERLEAIAGYIREGNRIFDLIGKDEKASAFIRCLITSYERLRNYCQEIGASELTAECIKRITELRERILQDEGDAEDECSTAEKGIRALLGFTRPGTGEYDVFLSHRSYDSDIAQDVYRFMKSRMKEVFFDNVSLSEELSDTDYKKAIYQSLENTTHFVVIVTDISELSPNYKKHKNDWMQEEMDVFHTEWIEGRKPEGNFIIIVTDDVYRQIVDANKKNIDLRWRRPTLIKLSEFRDLLPGYIRIE